MADAPLQAIVAAFKGADGASRALAELKGIDEDVLQVREAAVLVRDADNKLRITESHHMVRGAVFGGVVGAVVGLVAGPVGWVTAGGAAVGALASRLRDTGFPDARLKEIGEALTPGTSALVVLVEERWSVDVQGRLRATAADVATEAVPAEVAAQLEEVGSGSSGAEGAD
jgi:uncharacterized membrane protein